MLVTLRKVFGAGIDGDVTVTGPEFRIGRSPECDLRPSCPRVSRVHCELILRDGSVTVRDLGSTNGTFVNGDWVPGERRLISGDKLSVGLCLFEVLFDPQEEVVTEGKQVESVDRESPAGEAPAGAPQHVGCLSV